MFQYKVCNMDYDNMLNQRLNQRYFPSNELQPNFDPRPLSTKYTHYMTENPTKQSNEILRNYPTFETSKTFFPGNAKAPIHGALQQVDLESLLNNRFMALQKNDHAYYIPSTNSELYNHNSNLQDKPSQINTYMKTNLPPKNIDKCNLAPKVFHNSTRYNLKNVK